MAERAWSPPNEKYPPPKPGEPALHLAARVGDHDVIRNLIEGGTPVDELFDIALDPGARAEPSTPLMVAAGSSDGATAETVQLLLEFGASVDAGQTGLSALWYACQGLGWNYPPGGDSDRVAVLLAAGADPHVKRSPGRHGGGAGVSALARAARTGDADRVRLMLEAGADPAPEGADPPYEIPLYQAAESGSVDCVRLLVAAGAPVNGPLDERDDPVIASATSLDVLAELLAAGADPSAQCAFEHRVAERIAHCRTTVVERTAMLRLLVNYGVDLDAPRRSALHGAAMTSDPEAVEVLLAAGADPHARPSSLGAVCFGWSDKRSDRIERVVGLLIAAGVDPDDTDANGYRPLHAALSPDTFGPGYQESDGFNVAATFALINNGASIDIAFPDSGYRPLHAAAAAGSDEVVGMLLERGADAFERAANGETPLDVARVAKAELESSPPTLARAKELDANESRAQRLLEGWQQGHSVSVDRAGRCVALLEARK